MTAVFVQGMHGMGDNLHQRAVVRQLMERHDVWLETPWPSIYHDLVGRGLRLVSRGSQLRTQAKNAEREAARYSSEPVPRHARVMRVHYPPAEVRRQGSVLRAMLSACRLDPSETDFRLPVPNAWLDLAESRLDSWGRPAKPLMIYRPLVERKEWGGAGPRNPDIDAYHELYAAIRERFFVVSIADITPGAEWFVSFEPDADVKLHAGELVFEELAALFSVADLVFTAPGFPVVLSQAVGAKHVAVFGGYERPYSFSSGLRFAKQLAIAPVRSCDCFRHDHGCDKRIDMAAALPRLKEFCGC